MNRGTRGPARGRDGAAGRDAGAGSVLVLGLVAVLVVLGLGVGALAGAQHARGVAQTAADLGALAGARSLALPGGLRAAEGSGLATQACELAEQVVHRNDAEPLGCEVDGDVVTVTAGRRGALGLARARARAGPASARPQWSARSSDLVREDGVQQPQGAVLVER